MNIVTCIVDFADGQSEIHHLGNRDGEPRCIDVSLLRASETNTCCVSWTGSWIQARYFCWFHRGGMMIPKAWMVRSVLGSFLQQVYILLIAPQWLAVTVLLLGSGK
jgi:hypothetical protein